VSRLGDNKSLLVWLLAGDVDLVLEELNFTNYFSQDERDKLRVLMLRVNNHELLVELRRDKPSEHP
jgi:hypothetical protein